MYFFVFSFQQKLNSNVRSEKNSVAMRLFRSRRHSDPPPCPTSNSGVEFQTVKAVPALVLDETSKKRSKSQAINKIKIKIKKRKKVYLTSADKALDF